MPSGSRAAEHDAKAWVTSHHRQPHHHIDETLRLYAVVRGDLEMPPGKTASQAGHAFLDAFLTSQSARPEIAASYAADPPGTKVVLTARDLPDLLGLQADCHRLGIPCALVTDSGHVLPPHFTGDPIVTALGFGPVTRREIGRITRRFALAR